MSGSSRPVSTPRSAWSTFRANWRSLTFWPSEPCRRRAGESPIDALPAALAASSGSPGTTTVKAGPSGVTSTRRTDPAASASTNPAGKVTARSSGLT